MPDEPVPQETKILIVDDTPANLDVLCQSLEPQGYGLSVASNGEAALALAPEIRPDLILLDVMMPGIDGFETCRRLKEMETTREIPIIFLTAKHDTEDIVRGFSLGCVDYIAKPFQYEEVLARIRTHLKLRYLARQLETRNRRLEDLNEMKNSFLGMASHDLRNPLATIQGFSRFLLNKGESLDQTERHRFLSSIHEVCGEMLALMNDLLDLSAIESGKLTLKPVRASFTEMIRSHAETYRVLASEKNLIIHMNLEDLPAFPFDARRLGQVVDNLLSNAVKFSPQGKNLFLGLDRRDSCARFVVRDEGPGLAPEEQARVFGPFEKLSPRPTAGEPSTGLGLAIAKKIVGIHGGTLRVESQKGRGATFICEIPMTGHDALPKGADKIG
ncbi:MAG: hybrid sensor histidine kinase/response regulator [Nitrospinae bacterium CG11_big_fil_rev_8_21_14_0_20_56_8]|nr:MAG: hybrid sensor histidine kinase/response regulator [Nitrospinae bacterium CG11_big_fil_rev_8_21_14_0_20_56_8]